MLLVCSIHAPAALSLTLEGKVYGDGVPLAQATIELRSSDNTLLDSDISDAVGAYSFTVEANTTYKIDITPPPGSPFTAATGNTVAISGVNLTKDFFLFSGQVSLLSGAIRLSTGEALTNGAEFSIQSQSGGSSYYVNSVGSYSVSVANDSYKLTGLYVAYPFYINGVQYSRISAMGSRPSSWDVGPFTVSGDTTQDYVMPEYVEVAGNVVDSNGVGIANIRVSGGSQYGSVNPVTTGADGSFRFFIVAGSGGYIYADAPQDSGWEDTRVSDLDFTTSQTSISVTPAKLPLLTGAIRLSTGEALTNGAEFSIQSQSGGSSYYVNSVGSYSVSVANDSYKLTGLYVAYPFYINGVQYSRISAMGSRPSSWDVGPFTVSGDTTQDYVMPEYVEVAGNVVDSNGVGIANIRVSGGSQYGSVNPVTTGADGSFRFFIVAGSGGYIYADAPQDSGWEDTRVSDLDFTTSQTSISVTPAKLPLLTGAIRLSTGEALTNGAEFSIQSQSGGSSYYVNSVGSYSVSVANDSYKLTGLYVAYPFYINGVQYSRISAMGSRPSSWDVGPFTVAGDTTQDYVMPEYVEVAGNVVDSNGVGIANIRVSGASDYGSVDPITTTSDGAFRFFVVAGSDGRLNVDAPLDSGILDQSVSGLNFEQSYTASLVMPVTDTAPPKFLISPTQLSVSQNAVTLAWQTDEPASSEVSGTGIADISVSDYRVSHEVTLTGLSPSTSYTATVAVTDRSGNGPVEASVSFTTPAAPDTAPPVITVSPVIANITDSSMVVQWSTNEPALTILQWGTSNLSNTTQLDAVYRTEHEVTLTGLTELTDYQVRVSATDIEGNGPTLSTILQVRTLSAPDTTAPKINAGPFISNVTDTEAMVSWVTNEPAVSGVSLNDGTAYAVYRDEDLVTEHAVRLTGLSASTTYYYTVSSTDEAGNGPTLSVEDSFITQAAADTLPPQLVEATKVVGVTHQSAVLHFQTDEPSSVTLSYGVAQDQLDQTVSVAKLGKRHVIQLSDLDSDQTYYFSARLTDSSANSAAQPVESFKTRPVAPISAPTYVAEPNVLVSGDGRALIRWDTSEATQCSITFGISGSSEERRLDIAGKRTSHQAMLTELLPGRLYSFSLTCRNVAGIAATYNSTGDGFGLTPNSASEWLFAVINNFFFNQAFAQTRGSFSFSQQVDSTGPVLLDSEFLHRNAENIVVRLRFDEPATVEARYGVSLLNKSVSSEAFKLEHVMVLAGLVANQQYTIEFRARDISGNAATTVKSSESSGSQQDESAPTLVGSPEFNQESATGVSVYFLTDEYAASSLSCARVDTGATFTQGIEGLGKSHPISLQDIDPNTNYDCVVRAVDTSNNKLISEPYRLAMGNAPAVFYTVTPSADVSGQIFPSSPQAVVEDGSKSFTLTPNSGYVIDVVEGNCAGSLAGSVYTVSSVTDNCTVDAKFKAEPVVVHVVTPAAGSGGSIAPSSSRSVANLNRINFTVKPDGGYEIASVGGTCGGSLSGSTYTTNAVTAACTVEASFTQITYDVTPSAGANGSISPATAQTIAQGATTTFTVTPDEGYTAAVAGSCGGALAGNTYTTNAVTAACTVEASFTQITYDVTPSAGANGSISPATAQTIAQGATTTFTVTPDEGYTAAVAGSCGGALAGNTYTTNAVTAACTVEASFTQITYDVTPSAGANGSISPATAQTIAQGATTTFTVTPDEGYTAAVAGSCGGALAGNTYTTNAVTAACTVEASFTQITYDVTPSAGANGSISPATAQTIAQGATTTFTVTPDEGYTAAVAGSCGGALAGNTYTTNAVTAACSVEASFTRTDVAVDLGSGESLTLDFSDSSNCRLIPGSAQSESSSEPPSDIASAIGKQVEFSLDSCAASESLSVTVDFGTALPEGAKAYKVLGDSWIEITTATIGETSVTYTLTDNGPYDSNSNLGEIDDPVTAATPVAIKATPVPTLPLYGLLTLGGLLGLFGLRKLKK